MIKLFLRLMVDGVSDPPFAYSMLRRLCSAATGGLLATGSSHLNGRSRTDGRLLTEVESRVVLDLIGQIGHGIAI